MSALVTARRRRPAATSAESRTGVLSACRIFVRIRRERVGWVSSGRVSPTRAGGKLLRKADAATRGQLAPERPVLPVRTCLFVVCPDLASRSEINPRRVVLAGFSYGGIATECATYAQIADGLAPDGRTTDRRAAADALRRQERTDPSGL